MFGPKPDRAIATDPVSLTTDTSTGHVRQSRNMGLKALHKLLDVGTCGLEPWLALLAKTPQSVTQVISTQRCRGTQHCVVLRTDAGASGWDWDRIPRARRQKDDEYFSEDEAMTLSVTQGTASRCAAHSTTVGKLVFRHEESCRTQQVDQHLLGPSYP